MHDYDGWLRGEFAQQRMKRAKRFILRACRTVWPPLPDDFAEDLMVRAEAFFWRIRPEIEAESVEHPAAYADTAVRRLLCQLVEQELARRRPLTRLEVLKAEEEPARDPAAEGEWDALFADELWEIVSNPELSALLHALPERDRKILNLRYIHQLTDREIARQLDASENGICQRRRRLKKLLRDTIRQGGR